MDVAWPRKPDARSRGLTEASAEAMGLPSDWLDTVRSWTGWTLRANGGWRSWLSSGCLSGLMMGSEDRLTGRRDDRTAACVNTPAEGSLDVWTV